MGVTKAPFINKSITEIFHFAKILVLFFQSLSFLVGVTTAVPLFQKNKDQYHDCLYSKNYYCEVNGTDIKTYFVVEWFLWHQTVTSSNKEILEMMPQNIFNGVFLTAYGCLSHIWLGFDADGGFLFWLPPILNSLRPNDPYASLNWVIIGLDNGLSPVRRQAIIWTNAGILLIGPLGTNFSAILIGIQAFSFKKLHLKMSSAKWRLFCLSLNELTWRMCPRQKLASCWLQLAIYTGWQLHEVLWLWNVQSRPLFTKQQHILM